MSRISIPFPDHASWQTEVEVRIGDVNHGGHLGHDHLVSLLAHARVGYFAWLGTKEWDTEGLSAFVVELEVSYLGEAFLGDRLRIEIAAGELGTRRLDLLYRATRDEDGRAVALARTRSVFVDRSTGRAAAVPDVMRRGQ